jgi:two-component system chemotaxis response regulator CheB
MDVEMPIMDGITAVKEIMSKSPTPILMFSASTHAGAKATFDALDAGAVDFLPKQLEEIDENRETAKSLLRRRVKTVAMQAVRIKQKGTVAKKQIQDTQRQNNVIKLHSTVCPKRNNQHFDLVTIIASTGGPVAIQKLIAKIPDNFLPPVILVQHMPGNFTSSFSDRLDQLCSVKVKQASDGDLIKSGLMLLAPGGKQMLVECNRGQNKVTLREKITGEIYSPSADITLSSIAENFTGNVLTLVLTGMGSDGKNGVAKLKQKGATIWVQNEASCIVYGMPKAVSEAGLADKVMNLEAMSEKLAGIS